MNRVQRKRVKGWRKPDNSVYVGRPTKFANPFVVGKMVDKRWLRYFTWDDIRHYFVEKNEVKTKQEAVRLFEWYHVKLIDLKDLKRIKDYDNLMCFCSVNEPCHADILIRHIETLKICNKL